MGILVFTIKRLRVSAGVRKDVSDETMRCVLRGTGYRFLLSQEEGFIEKGRS